MPRKKTATNSQMSASDFVRSQPRSMTAPQVVEAGKANGINFSQNLVYAVRAAAKKKGRKAGASNGAAQRSTGASADVQFRKLVLELGVARSRALVGEVESAIAKVIRGG